jgi:DNA topoisomerase VI subunit B
LLYEELLPNTRNLAILFCWGKQDTLDAEGKPHPTGGNAAACRKMAEVIRAAKFKRFLSVELEDVGHIGVAPPADMLAKLIKQKRRNYPKHVRQVFRLADQSDAYWVGADALAGEPLPGDRLQIPIAPDEDPIAAQRKWITDKLGLIEARCKGQQIRITARRTPHVILLLSDELLNLDRPVTITRGKKERFKGRIKRDLSVMLTEAARGWDFQRLPVARVVIPLGGKVKFGYPTADKQQGEEKGRRSKN